MSSNSMKTPRIDVGSIRREQIVQAAVSVIAEQGLQNLSLSEIEKKAGMSRGQLTYYYPAKEDILLAVFDRLIQMMHERAAGGFRPDGTGPCSLPEEGWVARGIPAEKAPVGSASFPGISARCNTPSSPRSATARTSGSGWRTSTRSGARPHGRRRGR